MNIVWDVFVNALKKGISFDEITIVPAGSFSPYYELSSGCLNQTEVYAGDIYEVNPIYRYPDIFTQLLEVEAEEEKKTLFNELFHFFYKVENELNDTRETFEISLLARDFEQGVYGMNIRDLFAFFTHDEKMLMAKLLRMQYRHGQSRKLLAMAVKQVFSLSYLYEMAEEKKILIYPGVRKCYVAEQKLAFIQQFFIPIDYEIEPYWRFHFGIMEVEETMRLDEVELY
ncbi:MAG: hypothetical protein IKL07_03450 [Clostridium sp.]|nr:hypothetical protein [Clostridium sp.]